MGPELPRWIAAFIAKLLPKQKNSGNNSVQVGSAGGDVTVVNVTQYVQTQPMRHWDSPPNDRLREQQRQVLRAMRALPDRRAVLRFMDREFGTGVVIELTPFQLLRLQRYVAKILGRDRR